MNAVRAAIRVGVILAAATLPCACQKAPGEVTLEAGKKIHTILTPGILKSIPDDEVEQAVIDYVSAKIGDDYDHEVQIVSKLPIGTQALYITWWVEAEVNNGGFNQYYWNSAGQFADQAAEAFEFFSAHEHAALMREANSLRAMEAEKMKFGPLDDQFIGMKEDLSALRIAKIRAMPEFFSGT